MITETIEVPAQALIDDLETHLKKDGSENIEKSESVKIAKEKSGTLFLMMAEELREKNHIEEELEEARGAIRTMAEKEKNNCLLIEKLYNEILTYRPKTSARPHDTNGTSEEVTAGWKEDHQNNYNEILRKTKERVGMS